MSRLGKPEVIREDGGFFTLVEQDEQYSVTIIERAEKTFEGEWDFYGCPRRTVEVKDMNALALWWLKKNPALLTQLRRPPLEDEVIRGAYTVSEGHIRIGDTLLTDLMKDLYGQKLMVIFRSPHVREFPMRSIRGIYSAAAIDSVCVGGGSNGGIPIPLTNLLDDTDWQDGEVIVRRDD